MSIVESYVHRGEERKDSCIAINQRLLKQDIKTSQYIDPSQVCIMVQLII
ncbi:hypothetical protein HanHA300_Chr13g0496711 [Helianthus annuus]|nr:hypothetical protein HanHA300_Chr13g0496711 [Helianthus annuus]KAJ0499007.1 hypothetical protein HanHA89_Chr13g0529361 [Helianthus annuus]KAJ0665021.1 hypothetical protein HanLR1_Chr13g0499391 [Helianthus annuus]